MGRPAGRMATLTGRPAMRSPVRRDVERAFWLKVAEGLTSEAAASACGVSGPVGSRLQAGHRRGRVRHHDLRRLVQPPPSPRRAHRRRHIHHPAETEATYYLQTPATIKVVTP
jgi:hypothetical protein